MTLKNSIGTLDTRAGVGHITRNIQVVSGPDYTWGYRVLVYGFLFSDVLTVGNVQIYGVEFAYGGQFDTEMSTMDINNIPIGSNLSVITSSSFHDCMSFCMNIQNVDSFLITNNVYYNAKNFHVLAL